MSRKFKGHVVKKRRIVYQKPTCGGYAETEVLRTIYNMVHSMIEKICENCKWWDKENLVWSACRRNPPNLSFPLVKGGGHTQFRGFWPETLKDDWCDDWCGEFEGEKCIREWVY